MFGESSRLLIQESYMPAWLVILIGYLLGSIPTAYIAGRVLKGQDIRHMGDENMGALNAWRMLGPRAGHYFQRVAPLPGGFDPLHPGQTAGGAAGLRLPFPRLTTTGCIAKLGLPAEPASG